MAIFSIIWIYRPYIYWAIYHIPLPEPEQSLHQKWIKTREKVKNCWVCNGKWQRKELLSDLITANYLNINLTNGTQMSKYFWFQDIFESASCGVQQSTGRRPIGPTRVQGRIILFLGIENFNVVKENYVCRLKILHLFIFSIKPIKILLFLLHLMY